MALITVNLKIVSPYGEEDTPTPVKSGTVTFTPVGHGKYGDALRTIETLMVPIVAGVLQYRNPLTNEISPLELTPGVWKVLVSPRPGPAWSEMKFTLVEGMEEPVNLAVLAPEISVGATQLAKGDPGPTITSWENNEDGTIKFLLSDGTYTDSGTMPSGPQGPVGGQGPIGPAGPQGVEGPKGDQGVQGPVGPAGMTWRGVWNPEDDYVNDDSVYHEGSSWFAAGDPTPGEEPSTDSAHWHALAMQGAQGIQGSQGIQGPEGPQGPVGLTGPSPELVWDGTALVIDGGAPVDLKGDPGADGADGLDGASPVLTWDGTSLAVDGVAGPDLKGEPGIDGVSATDATVAEFVTSGAGTGAAVDERISGAIESNGYWTTLEAHGAYNDGVADQSAAIVAAIAAAKAAGGGIVYGKPGSSYGFTQRIRIPYRVTLDLGPTNHGAELSMRASTAGLEVEAGGRFIGTLYGGRSTYTGPALEINDEKTVQPFGTGYRQTVVDARIILGRQAGSTGILIRSNTGSGVSWAEIKAHVNAADYPLVLAAGGASGYVNENRIDIQAYDAREFASLTVETGGREVSHNVINLVTQTSVLPRLQRILRSDGRLNEIHVFSWDVRAETLDPTFEGALVFHSELSGGNKLTGHLSLLNTAKPLSVDLAPAIRANTVLLDDMRVIQPDSRPRQLPSIQTPSMNGNEDDELAFAADGRYPVTTSGATPPASGLREIFVPSGSSMTVPQLTECVIEVDTGHATGWTEHHATGVLFNGAPDRLIIEASNDLIDWQTVLDAGELGEPIPAAVSRFDRGGIRGGRYWRLTMTNAAPRDVTMTRWYLAEAGSGRTGGAWLPRHQPDVLGYLQLGEIADPAAPADGKARLFIRTDGLGKSQLCVRFASGGVQVITTET